MKYILLVAALLVSSSVAAKEISETEYNTVLKEINTPDNQEKVKSFLNNLDNFNIGGSQDIDVLWSFYHASGSRRIVEKIIQLLDDKSFSTGNAQINQIVSNAARLSLAANAGRYNKVRQIILDSANSLPNGPLKQKLLQIINQISQ
ncbi:MAG TPA: hypothetical protein DIV86_06630 [Alphaproteobacteria bacterium]|nr:hypothetical protein [Alphaproteobacteria bacterium]